MRKKKENQKGRRFRRVACGFLAFGAIFTLISDKSKIVSSAAAETYRPKTVVVASHIKQAPAATQTPISEVATGFGDKKGKDIVGALAKRMGFWPEKRKVNRVGYSYVQWVRGDGTDYNVYNYIFETDEEDNMRYAQFMIAPRDTIAYFSKVISLFFSRDDAQKIEAFIAAHKEAGEATYAIADMIITHDRNDSNVMLLIWRDNNQIAGDLI